MYQRLGDRIHQGDIIKGYVNPIINSEGVLSRMTYPYLVVVSQECDLEQDFNNRNNPDKKNHDKYIHSILLCPAFIAESLKIGKQFEEIGIQMDTYGGELWSFIKSNQNKRYHLLQNNIEQGVPADIVVDFKHYLTIPSQELYKKWSEYYSTSIETPYREQISQRFTYYLSRIPI